jgi:uncharacterized membrane protein
MAPLGRPHDRVHRAHVRPRAPSDRRHRARRVGRRTALPRDFAEAVAYGDLATSVLAVLTLLALRARLGIAIALVWLVNVVGTADLVNALIGGVRYDVSRLGMGSFWYVVTILVPILWITHVLAFALLLRRRA